MRCVLLCVQAAIDDELCLLEVLEVMEVTRRALLCMLETAEGGFVLLEAPEVIRCVRLCILEAVEGGLCCWRCWMW